MAEKKIQENPLPKEQQATSEQPRDMQIKTTSDKDSTAVPLPTESSVPVIPVISFPVLDKNPPNELYKNLLPAVLFLLTFVTVMTMLLTYMDAVALGAQQFRLNMSRDYDLARIPQESSALVAYVRQLHLAPRAQRPTPAVNEPTRSVKVLDSLYGEIYNGTFIDILPSGGRDPTTQYLETARQWDGVVVRAAPKDYLALRGAARALHACLSPTNHPREVTYHEAEGREPSAFISRVLCLPLYTVLLAAEAPRAQYALLAGGTGGTGGGGGALSALRHLPFSQVRLQVIEVRSSDASSRNQTTEFLLSKNYTVAATFEDSIIYALKEA